MKKKVATPAKKKVTEKWAWMFKGDYEETYRTFTSRDAAIKDAVKAVQEDSYYNNKNRVVMLFKMVEEVELEITVKEIPVTKKTVTAKVKS